MFGCAGMAASVHLQWFSVCTAVSADVAAAADMTGLRSLIANSPTPRRLVTERWPIPCIYIYISEAWAYGHCPHGQTGGYDGPVRLTAG